ncbi:MAG: cation-transporting P-type ATPase [Candidatus Aenigmarchaeota archaeon]|nr:cation-transporting P-type ATPase [Candidatus Aenigmarchaeota archaeon]
MDRQWHKISAEEAIKLLGSSKNGLSIEEFEKRKRIYKKNIIYEEYDINILKIILSQFKSFLIILLLIAATISLVIGEVLDFFLIISFALIIVTIGFVQEYKAEKIVKQLKKMTLPQVKVIRGGKQIEVSSADLVPGDIIILIAGDKVPADARIIEAHSLEVDESLLTGESVPVKKTSDIIKEDVEIADRINMLFSGSTVTHGRCMAIVTETGNKTEIGKIAKLVSQEEEKSPLKSEVDKLGKQLAFLVLTFCLVIFLISISKGMEVRYAFLAVLALAVSAVPESLPIIITVSLAVGANVMARKKALVRKFAAIESLSSIDVICTDKTGTLTRNELTVREIYTNKKFIVSGSGYIPEGEFYLDNKKIDPTKDERLFMLIKTGVICNNAVLKNDTGNYWVMGSPLEGALLVLAKKAKVDIERKEENLIFEIPFDSERKMMSVAYRDKTNFVFSKGAPEVLIEKCSYDFDGKMLTERKKKLIISQAREMASRGLRTLALAYKKTDKPKPNNAEAGLYFIGIVGMIDPPRTEVREALRKCREAGINVKIITGDHELTAMYVAKEAGMKVRKIISGKDMNNMTFERLVEIVDDIDIFARITPEHKIKIVQALRERGHRVLVTGDGINDAPALKMSEVGISMGRGTEVAKEASDIILVEEDFNTIVHAIEEGRRVYQNIRNSVVYLVSTSVAEVFVILASAISGLPFPYTAKQILWLNIVTEGIPATGFAFERGERDLLKEKPKDPKQGFLDRKIAKRIISLSTLMFVCVFSLYFFFFKKGLATAGTIAFNTMIWFELFNALNCRSERTSIFKMKLKDNITFVTLFSISVLLQTVAIFNPTFLRIMGLEPIGFKEFLISLIVASSILILGELKKRKYNYLPF